MNARWYKCFCWLVFLRVLQAFGTSAAYPAGLALFRAQARHATGEAVQPPAAALGTISMTSNVSAALGPALGGVLLLVANWQAIFLINIPLVVVGLVLALLPLPKDRLVHDDQLWFASVAGKSSWLRSRAIWTLDATLHWCGYPYDVCMVLGIPNGLQNLGLQAALYAAAPAKDMGVAAGQFQTFRYLGSILSTSLLGLLFGGTTTTGGLHLLAVALACISVLLLAGTVRLRMPGNHASLS